MFISKKKNRALRKLSHWYGRVKEQYPSFTQADIHHEKSEANFRQPRQWFPVPQRAKMLSLASAGIELVVHAAHAAVVVTATAARRLLLLFRSFGDQALGGEQQSRDGGGVL